MDKEVLMDLGIVTFLVSVVLLSLSGVLMPGPVTAVALARGSENAHAGAWVAIGHGAIEFPLMAAIYFGAGALFQLMPVKMVIGAVGGLLLLWMGYGMLRHMGDPITTSPDTPTDRFSSSPFWAGLFLSAGNPYFLVWWATVGAALVGKSFAFGAVGFLALAIAHWLCDFIWFYFLSALSFGGKRFFGARAQKSVFAVCGLAIFYFSGYFISGSALLALELI